MKKGIGILFCAAFLLKGANVLAQLPASPWNTQEFDAAVKASSTTSTSMSTGGADVGHLKPDTKRVNIPSITYNPSNADSQAPVYVPAVDSRGNSKAGALVRSISSAQDSQTRNLKERKKAPAAEDQDPDSQTQDYQADRQFTGTWRGSGTFGKLDYTGRVTTYDKAYGQQMLAPEVNTHNMNVMLQHLRNLGYKIPESYDDKFKNMTQNYAKDLRKAYNSLGHQRNPFDTMFSGFLDIVEEQSGLDMENLLFNSVDLISKD